MERILLDGEWSSYYLDQRTSNLHSPADLRDSHLTALPARVPGNVELDLYRAGILADPYVELNARDLRAYEPYEWWYETEFLVPRAAEGQRLELLFHGVDCLATYWLNGELIGTSENMFIEHTFDVTHRVYFDRPNSLVVRIGSAILAAAAQPSDPTMGALPGNWGQLRIRKAPHSYGWDIMPRAVSAGIWRSVELVIHDNTEIVDAYFITRHVDAAAARLEVYYELQVEGGIQDNLVLEISGELAGGNVNGPAFHARQPVHFPTGRTGITISHPQLWWPRGYGEPHTYQVTLRLWQGDSLLAERSWDHIGIRTVVLDRTEVTSLQQPGRFIFKVNGVPIMCKGSNWVPLDMFHSRDADRYEAAFALVEESGCNILRCWGGNVYEDTAFFHWCDTHGVMVWQDFAMACAEYPQDEEFYACIATEAQAVVRKLRNHPSLILWCGDNECDTFWLGRGMDPGENKITRQVLADVVRRHDPARPYLPSSPYVAPEIARGASQKLMPEQHPWGPRDYYKSDFYQGITAHFISEIGFHGCPNVKSIERFIAPEYLWPPQDNVQWIAHCTDSIGADGPYAYRVNLMLDQVRELFATLPDNLADFALASQIYQAEAFKFHIETTRLRKWERTGVIWWNLLDGWPQFSDAVVDYYLSKKLAYHYIRRSQVPVCLMVGEPTHWYAPVVVCNDTRDAVSGHFRLWDADTGEILLEDDYRVGPNENRQVGRLRIYRGERRCYLMRWTAGGSEFGNHYLQGYPPFALDGYRRWLEEIASLPLGFDAQRVGLG